MIIAVAIAVAVLAGVAAFVLMFALLTRDEIPGMSRWAYTRKAMVWLLTGMHWERNPCNPACR